MNVHKSATRTGRRDMSTKKRKAGGDCWAPTPEPPRQIDFEQKPYFYRIFFAELYSEVLPLPRDFLKHIEHEPRRLASLVGPSENVWSVMLLKDAKGISFQDGWQEFVADHGICEPDFLLFRYDGDLRFTVQIFDITACEKQAAFLATPNQELMVLDWERTETRQQAPVRNLQNFQDSDDVGCISGSEHNDTVKRQHRSYACNGHDNARLAASTKPPTEALGRPGSYEQEENPELQEEKSQELVHCDSLSQESSVCEGIMEQRLIVPDKTPEPPELSGLKRTNRVDQKRTRKKNIVSEPCSSLRAMPLEASKDQSFLLPVLYSTTWLNKLPPASIQVSRPSSSLVSHRRPITKHEIWSTIDAARSFTSKHPFTLVVMKETYVYRGFSLNIPKSFVRAHLGLDRRKLKLWDPTGTPWIVNYVSSGGRGCLSGGWPAFSQINNLELGDVCVFELIRKNEMRVHIFRVVEEVTPLTRVAPQLMLEGPPRVRV